MKHAGYILLGIIGLPITLFIAVLGITLFIICFPVALLHDFGVEIIGSKKKMDKWLFS